MKRWGILVIGVFLLLVCRGLFTYPWFASHDGDYMLLRSYVASQMIAAGQFPLFWSGTLNAGCGAPVFVFFYPLVAMIVGGLGSLGLSVLILQKLMYVSIFVISAYSTYGLVKAKTKDEILSTTAALLYLLAPYRLALVYVRGSIEGLGYALLPLLLWMIARVYAKSSKANTALAVVAGVAFMLAHNIVAVIGMPLVCLYLLYKSYQTGKWRLPAILLGLWIGLSAFFWFPALLEQKYTKLIVQVPEIANNLATIKQLIYSPWGFGPASFGPPQGMSLSIGLAQWAAVGLALLGSLMIKSKEKRIVAWVLIGLFGITIFFISSFSLPIWEQIKLLGIIQFPWRLLGLAVMVAVLGFVVVMGGLKRKRLTAVICLALVGLAYLGVRHDFGSNPPQFPGTYADLNTHPYRFTTTTVSDEILPLGADLACNVKEPFVFNEGMSLVSKAVGEMGGEAKFTSPSSGETDVKINLSYFPDRYEIRVNGQKVGYVDARGKVNLEAVQLQEGENIIQWKIQRTPLEQIFLGVSLASLGLFLIVLAIPKSKFL